MSFGSKNFLEKKINNFLAGKDIISFPSRYLAYAEHSSDFGLLSKNDWFKEVGSSDYAGFKSFLRIVFFKCVIDDDGKWSDFKNIFLDGLENANYDLSKKTMESFDNNSKVMMEAVLFRNGFVLIRGDDSVHSEMSLELFEGYSFIRDAWHFHRFHRDDDDVVLRFNLVDRPLNGLKDLKNQMYYYVNAFESFVIKSQRPDKVRSKELVVSERLEYLDISGMILYMNSLKNIVYSFSGDEEKKQDSKGGHIEVAVKKIDQRGIMDETFDKGMAAYAGFFISAFSMMAVFFVNYFRFLEKCTPDFTSAGFSEFCDFYEFLGNQDASNFVFNGSLWLLSVLLFVSIILSFSLLSSRVKVFRDYSVGWKFSERSFSVYQVIRYLENSRFIPSLASCVNGRGVGLSHFLSYFVFVFADLVCLVVSRKVNLFWCLKILLLSFVSVVIWLALAFSESVMVLLFLFVPISTVSLSLFYRMVRFPLILATTCQFVCLTEIERKFNPPA